MTAIVFYVLVVLVWTPSLYDVGQELAGRRNPFRRCGDCGCPHLFHRVFCWRPFEERR